MNLFTEKNFIGNLVKEFSKDNSFYRPLVGLPNGDFARVSDDDFIEIWNSYTMEIKQNITIFRNISNYIGILSNGHLAILYPREVIILNINNSSIKQVISLDSKYGDSNRFVISKNDDIILGTSPSENPILIINSQLELQEYNFTSAPYEYLLGIKSLSNGNLALITSSSAYYVKIFNPQSGSFVKNYSFPFQITDIEFLNDTHLILSLFTNGTVQIWNLDSNSYENLNLEYDANYFGKLYSIFGFYVFKNGDLLILVNLASEYGGYINVWDPKNRVLKKAFKACDSGIQNFNIMPNENLLLGCSNEIVIWE